MRKLIRILIAVIIVSRIAGGAVAPASITQAEAESFVRAFYHDMEGDDLDKVMTHFDSTVEYYNFGAKDRSYVASDLGQYCASYPGRSFSVGEIKLKPVPNSDRVTAKFDIRFFIRNPERDRTRSGRSHVEWDLVKRDGVLKITRFDGSAVTEPTPSPSK